MNKQTFLNKLEKYSLNWPEEDFHINIIKRLLPVMFDFISYLLEVEELSDKTIKLYIDMLNILGYTVIKDLCINPDYKYPEDDNKLFLNYIQDGGTPPRASHNMSNETLKKYERMCNKFEKYINIRTTYSK